MTRTDAELLIASRDDAAAFRELYDRWAEPLLACFAPHEHGEIMWLVERSDPSKGAGPDRRHGLDWE